MKTLVCDMCGGTDFIKEGGLFLCRQCGLKYSLEEARSMMRDVPDAAPAASETAPESDGQDVSPGELLQKRFEIARRARSRREWDVAAQNYSLIEQSDPENIEAAFYGPYARAMQSLIRSDVYERQTAFNLLSNVLSAMDKRFSIEKNVLHESDINQITDALAEMIKSNIEYNSWQNEYGFGYATNPQDTYILFSSLLYAYKNMIDSIARMDDKPYLHQAAIRLYSASHNLGSGNWESLIREWIDGENRSLNILWNKRISDYWERNEEERLKLFGEKNDLVNRINEKNMVISQLPQSQSVRTLEGKIAGLEEQKSHLGLFNFDERAQIQDQIDYFNDRLAMARQNMDMAAAPYYSEIGEIERRIREIDAEIVNRPFAEN